MEGWKEGGESEKAGEGGRGREGKGEKERERVRERDRERARALSPKPQTSNPNRSPLGLVTLGLVLWLRCMGEKKVKAKDAQF